MLSAGRVLLALVAVELVEHERDGQRKIRVSFHEECGEEHGMEVAIVEAEELHRPGGWPRRGGLELQQVPRCHLEPDVDPLALEPYRCRHRDTPARGMTDRDLGQAVCCHRLAERP